MRRMIIAVLLVASVTGIGFYYFTGRGGNPSEKQAVLAAATQRFKFELHDCLVYNQQLYEHDRQKIERGDPGATGNPKEPRLKELEEWYAFEQETCQKAYEDKIDYWQKTQ